MNKKKKWKLVFKKKIKKALKKKQKKQKINENFLLIKEMYKTNPYTD